MKHFLSIILALFVCLNVSFSQPLLLQTIKGVVIDADSKEPLTGIVVTINGKIGNTITDSTGRFKINAVPVGLQTIEFSANNYETKVIEGIEVTSGKEFFLQVTLNEKITFLSEIVIRSNKKQNNSLNEFASVSARSFSMDDTKKYPITGFDPGRIAQNFAGVSLTEDNSNAIIIRGNSPKGILWKLEGIEIPNPNHFGSTGSGGGNISMLSSSTLDKSDFYAGAFPAEFGNALSGVFDLKLRKGNSDKHEHSIMVGDLGIEASTEGPINRKAGSSYLVNFRYSTFALIKGIAEIDGVTPDYQDLSFKFNFPTKKAGTFSIFGLGGINKQLREPVIFGGFRPIMALFRVEEKGLLGVVGLSQQIFLNKKSYLQNTIAATSDNYYSNVDTLDYNNNYARGAVGRTKFISPTYKWATTYNNKINNHHTIQIGLITSYLGYNFIDSQYNGINNSLRVIFNSKGNSFLYEAYLQWKWRLNSHIDIIPGIHYTMLALNKAKSIEPRFSLTYYAPGSQKISLAAGLHSKPEHLSTYFFQNLKSNLPGFAYQNLGLTKAAHATLSYQKNLKNISIKAEAYYQYLYNVPVEKDSAGFFSMVNALSVYDLYDLDSQLVNNGKGKNYGLDVSIEKPFLKNWHFLTTASVFRSGYTAYNGKSFHTRFDRNFQLIVITGKEWKASHNNKRRLGANAKVLVAGGLRESPIDYERSAAQHKIVYAVDKYYSLQTTPYSRMDMGISYRINRPKSTHIIMLDVQNIFNQKNVVRTTYDIQAKQTSKDYSLGIFPLFNYRIEFSKNS
ncbi:MAG: TonB-dependent receptor [Ginsengibacter sp.]